MKKGVKKENTCLVGCFKDRVDVGCVLLQEGHNEAFKDELRSLHVHR